MTDYLVILILYKQVERVLDEEQILSFDKRTKLLLKKKPTNLILITLSQKEYTVKFNIFLFKIHITSSDNHPPHFSST
jgi:hypothetical protein